MNTSQIKEQFRKISNSPCWNVKKGIGSYLTFEFGEPQIEFIEPKIWKQFGHPVNLNEIRRVFIKGTEMLWIYCVDWKIISKGSEIAHNESDDKQINNATTILNGQILNQIEINTKIGETKFTFDLGGELETCNKTHDNTDESWMLFVGESVLTMNNLGQFNLSESSKVTKEEDFVTIRDERIKITLHNK